MIARIILSLTVAFSAGVQAQEKAVWQQKLSKHLQADFPYTKAAVRTQFPKNNVANKGMAIIVGREAFMCFDTDLLRWAAGWTEVIGPAEIEIHLPTPVGLVQPQHLC